MNNRGYRTLKHRTKYVEYIRLDYVVNIHTVSVNIKPYMKNNKKFSCTYNLQIHCVPNYIKNISFTK